MPVLTNEICLVNNVFILEFYSTTLQDSYEKLNDNLSDLFKTPIKAQKSNQIDRREGVQQRLYE